MRRLLAEVLECSSVGERLAVTRFAAPEIARACQAGQFLLLRVAARGSHDPLLRRPSWVFRAGGDELRLAHEGQPWSVGDRLDVLGPLGRGFSLAPNTRNLLLVGAGAGVAPLAALADQALARDANVTLLADAGGIPPEMLAPQVEYVATAESPPLADLVAWADQIAVALPSEALPALARGIAGTSKPVQVALGGWLGCGTGICQACVVRTRRGPRRICRDGPVFDLAELA